MKIGTENVVISGIGINTKYYRSFKDIMENLNNEVRGEDLTDITYVEKYISKFKLGKMSKATILAIITAKQAMEMGNIEPVDIENSGIIVGTNYACFDKVIEFYKSVTFPLDTRIQPSTFSNSANSALSGEVAAELGMHGVNYTFSSGILSSMEAIHAGYNVLNCSEEQNIILVGGIDSYTGKYMIDEQNVNAGIVLLLEEESHNLERNSHAFGLIEFIKMDTLRSMLYNKLENNIILITNTEIEGVNQDILLDNCGGISGMLAVVYACAILENKNDIQKYVCKKTNRNFKNINKIIICIDDNKRSLCMVINKINY